MVRKISEKQGKWVVETIYSDGETDRRVFGSEDEAFHRASELECFSDCTDVSDVNVYHQERRYHYVGWQPGMLYEFADEYGTVVWGRYYPEWDH